MPVSDEVARLRAKLSVYVLKSLLDISLNDARMLQAIRSHGPICRERLMIIGEVKAKASSSLGVRLHKVREALRDVTDEAQPIVCEPGKGWRLSLGAGAVLDELIAAQIAA